MTTGEHRAGPATRTEARSQAPTGPAVVAGHALATRAHRSALAGQPTQPHS